MPNLWRARAVRWLCSSAIPLAAASAPAQALAEDAAVSAEVQELVVTALKREQSLRDVPASITALGGQALEQRQVTSVADLNTRIPSLNSGTIADATIITLRGIGSRVPGGTGQNTVAVHIDGVYVGPPTALTLPVYDLERVEVLRGPQGTLYGKNATGGAINFITKLPPDEFRGEAAAMYGSYGSYRVRGNVGGPLAPGWGGRLSVVHERRDPGEENPFPGVKKPGVIDTTAVRAVVQFEPTASFSASLRGYFERDSGESSLNGDRVPIDCTRPAPRTPLEPVAPSAHFCSIYAVAPAPRMTTEPHKSVTNIDAPLVKKQEGATLQVRADAAGINISSTTGYLFHTYRNEYDADRTSANYFDAFNRVRSLEWSQDVTFTTTTGPIDWLVGLYYYHQHLTNENPLFFPNGAAPTGAFSVPGLALRGGANHQTEAYAIYTDNRIHLGEKLTLTAGVRWNRDRKDFTYRNVYVVPGAGPGGTSLVLGPTVGGCFDQSQSKGWTSVTPRANAEYKFSPRQMAYVQYSEGFKSGGFTQACNEGSYEPEELTSYEAGYKAEFPDQGLALALTAFHYDYTNLQVYQSTVSARNTPVTRIENARGAEVDGAELEISWAPGNQVRVDLGVSYLDGRYTDYFSDNNLFGNNRAFDPVTNPAGVLLQDVSGRPLDQAPRWSGSVGLEKTWDLANGSTLLARGEAYFSTRVWFRPFPERLNSQSSYGLLNLYLTWTSSDRTLVARAFGKNVLDKDYVAQLLPFPTTATYKVQYGERRMLGVELLKSF